MLLFDSQKIGYVKKTHGINGEILVAIDFPIPHNFELSEWAFLQKEGMLIPFQVEYYQTINKYSCILKFTDTNDINYIKRFVLSPVFIPTNVPWLKNIPPIYQNLAGYDVYENNHLKGKITQMFPIKNNPVVELEYNKNRFLIPFRDEFIQQIDHKLKKIYVNLPL